MPIVINEVEIFDAPTPTRPASTPGPSRPEPAYEQLRRLQRDLDARQRRLIAD